MRAFDYSVLPPERLFSSYADCPGIFWRFNGKGEYGPHPLHSVTSYFARRLEPIEGRFTDEQGWRPLSYFLDLWEQIPPSANTLRRLKRVGQTGQKTFTESSGRRFLNELRKAKPPTARQIEKLAQLGLSTTEITRRDQAEKVIWEHEKAAFKENERLAEAPEVAGYRRRLAELRPKVQEHWPDWEPSQFDDASSYDIYVSAIELALDHARGFDLEELQGNVFSDGVTDKDYYLHFKRDPTPNELRAFQAEIFRACLLEDSESFDHLPILKRTLPMIRVEVL